MGPPAPATKLPTTPESTAPPCEEPEILVGPTVIAATAGCVVGGILLGPVGLVVGGVGVALSTRAVLRRRRRRGRIFVVPRGSVRIRTGGRWGGGRRGGGGRRR